MNQTHKLDKVFIEHSLLKLLYLSVKNPYNGISDDQDYRIVIRNMLKISKQLGVELKLDDEDNIIHHDMKQLIHDIMYQTEEVEWWTN